MRLTKQIAGLGHVKGHTSEIPEKAETQKMIAIDIVAALANLILAVVAVVGLIYNYQQIQENRKQAQEAQKQQIETQQNLHRPFLIPTSTTLKLDDNHPDWNDPTQNITLRNAGLGLATNIRGCILVASYQLGAYGFTLEPEYPLPKDEALTIPVGQPRSLPSAASRIENYDLTAPEGKFARLTLTYQDVFGKNHASIFDWGMWYGKLIWVQVAFLKDIPKGLTELKIERIRPAVTPSEP